jgi:hypothetical protein
MLAALPAVTIKPTLEYDSKPHTLKGPLLADVLKAAGVKVNDKTTVAMRAVDGYAAQVTASPKSPSTASSSPRTWTASRCRWAAGPAVGGV